MMQGRNQFIKEKAQLLLPLKAEEAALFSSVPVDGRIEACARVQSSLVTVKL